MATTPKSSKGASVSFSNTPQAKDDTFTANSTGLTEDSYNILYLDVMANDHGGKGKTLYSLDDTVSVSATKKAYAPADLLVQDIAGVVGLSKFGAEISITADGKVAYNMNTAAFRAKFQSLSADMDDTDDDDVSSDDDADGSKSGRSAAHDSRDKDSDADHSRSKDSDSGDSRSDDAGDDDAKDDDFDPHTGYDTFTYAIRLANGTLSWATATVEIAGRNDAPTVSAQTANATEGGSSVTVNALQTAADVDAGARLKVVDVPMDLPAGVTYDKETHSFTLAPDHPAYNHLAQDATTNVVVSYAVSDGIISTPTSITFTVIGSNDGPAAIADVAFGGENETLTIDVLANDTDPDDGHVFTLNAVSAPAGQGTARVVDNQLQFDPGPDFDHLAQDATAAVTLSYEMQDEYGAKSTSSVLVTVTGSNDGPLAVADRAFGSENETLTIDVLANDTDLDDGHVFTLNAASAPAGQGTARVVDNQLQFDPGPDFDHLAQDATAAVTLSYEMQDEYGAKSTSSVLVTVTGSNDGPLAVADRAFGSENDTLTIDVLANDTDLDDGHVFTLNAVSAPVGQGLARVVDNQLQFDPGPDFDHLAQDATAAVTLSYEMQDEYGAKSTSSVLVTVTGSNDGPLAVADRAFGSENDTLTIDVLANDTDPDDSHVFTLNAVSAPAGQGTARVVNNQLQFNPGPDFDYLAKDATALVSLSYEMQDEHGAKSTSTVDVTVTGVNDAPVVAEPLSSVTNEDAAPYAINLLDGASDVDSGSVLHAGTITEASGKGGWSVDGDRLTLNPDFYNQMNSGEVEALQFSYQIMDEHGATADQSLAVTIEGITDAPYLAVTTSAGTRVNEIRLLVSSQPANTERVALSFGGLPPGAIVFDQDLNVVTAGVNDYCGATYGGTETFTLLLPEGSDVNTELAVTVTGHRGDGSEIGSTVQAVDLLYDVTTATDSLSFSSNNNSMWGNFDGYIGWHEYIPFIGGAPVQWDAQDEKWTDVAGGGDYWRSGEFTLVDVSLDSGEISAEALKVVKAPLDLAIAGQTEAANLLAAANAWDTDSGARYNHAAGVANAWVAFDAANVLYTAANITYNVAKGTFDIAQGAFDVARDIFVGLENAYNSAYSTWQTADQAYNDSIVWILGVPVGDPIKWGIAVAAWAVQGTEWLALEAGRPLYNGAVTLFNEAKNVLTPIEQAANAAEGLKNSAYTNAIGLENAMHAAGYYTDRFRAEGDAVIVVDSGLAWAEHLLAEGAVVGAQAVKVGADGAVLLAKGAYDLAHDALALVDFDADLQVQTDLFAQAGLQVDFDLDSGSVDTEIDYQLTSTTQYNQTTDMLAITPLMTNMTSGDTVAFETISPNVKFHAAILYDVGADLDLTVDGHLNVAGQTLFDLTPGTTAPIQISTTISTSAIPEVPEGVPTSPVLEMIQNNMPSGELELIDFDSATDLAGPFEVPGINYLLGLVGADDILTIELAFPTVQTAGVAEVYSQDYFEEGGLVGVDFSEITGSLFNLLQAKIDYSPEMKQLAGISGNLLGNLTFDQLVDNALKAFSATVFDALDGQSEGVPVFLIDATDETSTSLLHVNTFPDNLSTINANTASFGFFAGYGDSEPVVKVDVDLDQAFSFIVNEITKAIVDAVAAGSTIAVTNAIPTINPFDLSIGMEEICEIFELPKEIADVINFEIGFQAADLDVHDAVDFSQEFTLSIDDMSYLVTMEDGFMSTFTANGAGALQIQDASSHDANHDGVIGYSLDIVPTTMFSNDTEIGLSMGYVFDLVKAGVSAGVKLPLGTLLDIPALGSIDIPGIDISLGPLLRIQGDLDLLDVDVFESRFALNIGSDSVTGGVDINLLGTGTTPADGAVG